MLSAIVVVGGSAAGLTAIETLRREGFTGAITSVCDEVYLPYDRPPLSKQVLSGSWEPSRTYLRPAEDLDKLDVDWLLNRRAVALDLRRRVVTLSTGAELEYDGLVIATGVTPRRLEAAHHLDKVHTLRSIEDAIALRESLLGASSLVVVGAGFLGAEVAAVARGTGCRVTLVDPLAAPMIRALGPDVGARFAALHGEHGVDVRCGVGVAAIEGENGNAAAVRLSDGSRIVADVVLVAVGCTPATGWLSGSGIPLGNGVTCDELLQVVPGVVAAGDVAAWPHPEVGMVRVEHRMNATEQGMAAARTLLGHGARFEPVPYFWSDQYDVKVQAYGFPSETAQFHVVSDEDGGRRFAGVYETNGHVVAALTWNMPAEARKLRPLVAARAAVADLGPAIAPRSATSRDLSRNASISAR